jgi:hypothetical protein
MATKARWTLQIRKPGRAYRTVETSNAYAAPYWSAHQYLTPYGRDSVRILGPKGEIVMRATPKTKQS